MGTREAASCSAGDAGRTAGPAASLAPCHPQAAQVRLRLVLDGSQTLDQALAGEAMRRHLVKWLPLYLVWIACWFLLAFRVTW